MSDHTEGTLARSLARLPMWLVVAIVPVIAAVAVALTGFGSSGDSSGASTAKPLPNTITIKDFSFAPEALTARAGTTITVTNADGTAHTVTAAKGAFDTGELAGGATAQITVDQPGTYAYFCNIHQYMKGTIHVD
jgi:plastocyanin